MSNKAFGKQGLLISLLLFAAMVAAGALFTPAAQPLAGSFGLCAPSPNLWELPQPAGRIANAVALMAAAAALTLANRRYTFIKGTDYSLPSLMLIMTASCPWLTASFNSGTLLLLANALCLPMLFATIDSRNATQPMFLIASVMGLGAMVQYAFLPLAAVYLAGAAVMKTLRLREIAAWLLGLAAPWWIAFGAGLLTPQSLRAPALSNLFDGFAPPAGILVIMLGCGLTMLATLMISLADMGRIRSAGSTVRRFNRVIGILSVSMAACMMADVTNMAAYLASFYMTSAVAFANMFALNRMQKPAAVAAVITAAYVVLLMLSL